jgi:hypothetical protein
MLKIKIDLDIKDLRQLRRVFDQLRNDIESGNESVTRDLNEAKYNYVMYFTEMRKRRVEEINGKFYYVVKSKVNK